MGFDIRRLDVYRKVPKDLTQPTLAGAAVSICSILFIVFLLLSEFTTFIKPDVVSELYVDNPGTIERLEVRLNITLPRLTCTVLGLDIQDDMGRHEVGYVDNTKKIPINENKGCLFETRFSVNKVPGNFHVSTHAAGMNQPPKPDFSHFIDQVTFGDDLSNSSIGQRAAFNALLKKDRLNAKAESSHDYYIKIVPTVYEDLWGNQNISYQYTFAYKCTSQAYPVHHFGRQNVHNGIDSQYGGNSSLALCGGAFCIVERVTEEYQNHGHGHRVLPAIWFRYDISPITVKYHEKRAPFYTFITTICAIVGGTFTVAGIIDALIFTAAEVFRKAELGKLH